MVKNPDAPNRENIRLLFLLLFLLTLLLPAPGIAAPEKIPAEIIPATQTEMALADSQKADLLLFWEEKDLYVQTATRTEKPLSQTAENMTIVTAKDIEDMNAHTVNEVLNRVPGLYVDFYGRNFMGTSMIHIQGSVLGSEDRHVAVLVDGVPLNFLSSNSAETSSIPVQIIDRIEIVKGPASSAWGSALGGVINIITKGTGDTTIPKGTLTASYGEANSQDFNGELYGRGGPVGYYLFAGHQQSDGLRDNRNANADKLYAKFSIAPSRDLDLLFSVGYSNPFSNSTGDNPLRSTNSTVKQSTFFATGSLDYRITPELGVKGSLYTSRLTFDAPGTALVTNKLMVENITDDHTIAGNLRLAYSGGIQNAVIGAEYSHGTLDRTIIYGAQFQSPPFNQPASTTVSPNLEKWALFANDTIVLGRFAITPGVRLDHNNISGYFVSPSLGTTYEAWEHTVIRASVARGFTSPPLGLSLGGGFFLDPNPGLKSERVWSYQGGVESSLSDYLRVKLTLFRHDSDDELTVVREPAKPPFKIYDNGGRVTRQGFELEAESVPIYNISLKAAHSYVNVDQHINPQATVNYSYQLGIKYDDRRSLIAQLFGGYNWWGLEPLNGAKYNNFIWELNITKKFPITDTITTDIFLNVHNLFGGSSYTTASSPNAKRWVEGGLRFKF